ncbi:MAG TPA: thioesterase family protein [Verrucomicrobiae bacterium]|nr:thioesterase family protein [Verrucomicrobiae bacterium]
MTTPQNPDRSRVIRRAASRPFIEDKTALRVRFNEVDSLHIVWHGHYVNYLEEGRRALGRRLGIDYPTFFEHGIAAPVIRLELSFLAPARLADDLEITTRLLKSESARLDFDYEIRSVPGGQLLATGNTSQVFTTPAGELILNWPAFMLERLKTWETLWRQP